MLEVLSTTTIVRGEIKFVSWTRLWKLVVDVVRRRRCHRTFSRGMTWRAMVTLNRMVKLERLRRGFKWTTTSVFDNLVEEAAFRVQLRVRSMDEWSCLEVSGVRARCGPRVFSRYMKTIGVMTTCRSFGVKRMVFKVLPCYLRREVVQVEMLRWDHVRSECWGNYVTMVLGCIHRPPATVANW